MHALAHYMATQPRERTYCNCAYQRGCQNFPTFLERYPAPDRVKNRGKISLSIGMTAECVAFPGLMVSGARAARRLERIVGLCLVA
jgi:hypothetical protein